jgi:hypothetical protein
MQELHELNGNGGSEHGRQPTRDLRLGPGDPEDACEHVGIERALVVPERPEEQRQERAVLASQAVEMEYALYESAASSRW